MVIVSNCHFYLFGNFSRYLFWCSVLVMCVNVWRSSWTPQTESKRNLNLVRVGISVRGSGFRIPWVFEAYMSSPYWYLILCFPNYRFPFQNRKTHVTKVWLLPPPEKVGFVLNIWNIRKTKTKYKTRGNKNEEKRKYRLIPRLSRAR